MDDLSSWLKILEGGGPMVPAIILGYLYWAERKAHEETRASRDALLERVLTTLSQNTTILAEWRRIWGG